MTCPLTPMKAIVLLRHTCTRTHRHIYICMHVCAHVHTHRSYACEVGCCTVALKTREDRVP